MLPTCASLSGEEVYRCCIVLVGLFFRFFCDEENKEREKNKLNDQPFNNPKREKVVKLRSFVEQHRGVLQHIPCMQPTSWDRWRQCRPTPDTTTKGGEGRRATTSP